MWLCRNMHPGLLSCVLVIQFVWESENNISRLKLLLLLKHVNLLILILGFKHGSRSPVKSSPRRPAVESISASAPAPANQGNPPGWFPAFWKMSSPNTHILYMTSATLLVSYEQLLFTQIRWSFMWQHFSEKMPWKDYLILFYLPLRC